MRAVIATLAGDGASESDLAGRIIDADGSPALAAFYFELERWQKLRLLCFALRHQDRAVLTLIPMTAGFRPNLTTIGEGASYQLSRFAYLRRDVGALVLESPLSAARVVVSVPKGAALVTSLAQSMTIDALIGTTAVDAPTLAEALQLLVAAGMAGAVDSGGELTEASDSALAQWDFHDLLFHARSRIGRHDYGYGGTYRFRDRLPSPPAIRPLSGDQLVPLPKPDLDRLASEDPPFVRVLEGRRSNRVFGETPITVGELGEFLYRTARVVRLIPADPEKGSLQDLSFRPYPGGGAVHELELYLTVNTCDGLERGLYHYDPLGHQLDRISGFDAKLEALLLTAQQSAGITDPPQILVTIASRFQRLAWKYESMAYAVTLKNVGGLYQTLYLVATAMGLAACGLGGGDSDAFADAAGTNYYAETSVGEFILGSRSPAEV
jgi:SagB-type dehydrogenase family enzyme